MSDSVSNSSGLAQKLRKKQYAFYESPVLFFKGILLLTVQMEMCAKTCFKLWR